MLFPKTLFVKLLVDSPVAVFQKDRASCAGDSECVNPRARKATRSVSPESGLIDAIRDLVTGFASAVLCLSALKLALHLIFHGLRQKY